MSIRLDPRRLSALKLLAAEAGMRPGELVTAWVEERLDAARAGKPSPAGSPDPALTALAARVDELALRLEAMAGAAAPAIGTETPDRETVAHEPESPAPRGRRRRAEKARTATAASEAAAGQPPVGAGGPRVPLHEEIAAVIRERGPLTAAEIAAAIGERGRYAAPRSNRPLDAATVNSRVSNPAYRERFKRSDGRIDLA